MMEKTPGIKSADSPQFIGKVPDCQAVQINWLSGRDIQVATQTVSIAGINSHLVTKTLQSMAEVAVSCD